MELNRGVAGFVGVSVVLAGLMLAGKQTQDSEKAQAQAYAHAAMWPAGPRQQALMLLERYGSPQRLSEDRMEWDGKGPWKSVVVSADWPLSPLTQTVSCHVSREKLEELARYPHGLTASVRRGELSARSDSEALNFLSLNLGMDILTGQRTPEEANRYFHKAIDLRYAGKSVPYMERLLFGVPQPPTWPAARDWFGNKL
ncbi:MAG: hypothetical protein NTY77_02145 [Elusimicrobia bacterium]|nr:hypothetical protein [Elusimicrobiota bacterium]